MKNRFLRCHLFVFFFLVSIINIFAQKKECYIDSIFTVSSEEMIFHVDKNDIRKGTIYLADNVKYSNKYTVSGYGSVFNIKSYKQIEAEKWLFYTSEGKLEQVKYIYSYNDDVSLFKEYTFDNNGNISKIIDYDKGYNICWQEAIEICKKLVGEKKIKKYNIKYFELYRQDLNKNPYNNSNIKPLWIVWPLTNKENENKYESKYLKGKKGNLFYIIDGVTGKFIKKIPKELLWIKDKS